MNYKYVLFWASLWFTIFLSQSLAQNVLDQANLNLVKADREYWRLMASSPKWLCRKRGGEYKFIRFSTDFETNSTDWECVGDKH